jgi:hypothetical protein
LLFSLVQEFLHCTEILGEGNNKKIKSEKCVQNKTNSKDYTKGFFFSKYNLFQ